MTLFLSSSVASSGHCESTSLCCACWLCSCVTCWWISFVRIVCLVVWSIVAVRESWMSSSRFLMSIMSSFFCIE